MALLRWIERVARNSGWSFHEESVERSMKPRNDGSIQTSFDSEHGFREGEAGYPLAGVALLEEGATGYPRAGVPVMRGGR
jgi:hypothetical protein